MTSPGPFEPGPYLEPGDLVLTRGKGWVSKAIRFLTRGIGEPRTKVNHAGLITAPGLLTSAVIVEAIRKVERNRLWIRYGPPDGDDVAIFRHRFITMEARARVAARMESFVGRKYDHLSIVGHTLDYFLLGAYFFRRILRRPRYAQCIWATAEACDDVGVRFGGPPAEMSPDHAWDWVKSHPDQWEEIHPLGPLSTLGRT